MDFFTDAVFSLTVGIGGVIGLVRFRRIDTAHRPVLFLVWLSFFQEAGSLCLVLLGYSNVVLYNAFLLAEALLICWQFWRWGVFGSRSFYVGLQGSFFLFWALEWLAQPPLVFLSYFTLFSSVTVVLLSLSCVQQLVFEGTVPLPRHPVFLLCVCFVMYFGYSALVEVFWLARLNRSPVFLIRVHVLLSYLNLFTNLLIAAAILWMPTRYRSITGC